MPVLFARSDLQRFISAQRSASSFASLPINIDVFPGIPLGRFSKSSEFSANAGQSFRDQILAEKVGRYAQTIGPPPSLRSWVIGRKKFRSGSARERGFETYTWRPIHAPVSLLVFWYTSCSISFLICSLWLRVAFPKVESKDSYIILFLIV